MPEQPLPQFSLKTILAITAAIALFFAAGSWFGAMGYVGFVLAAGFVATCKSSRDIFDFVLKSGIYVVFVAVTSCCWWPLMLLEERPYSPRSQCNNNLRQIGLALQNYHDVYGCFPPVYTTDESGKPMHSWRVLILPFIEQQSLYARYNFNEPWDGPHNSLLAKEMPAVFRCPEDKANPGTLTDYVAIVGPETIWQPDRSTTFAQITDGSSNTIAVVEAAGLGVNWTEPRDLQFAAVANGINPKQGPGMSGHHPGAVIAVFADGHTQTIQESNSRDLLKAICTKAGGEEIDEDF